MMKVVLVFVLMFGLVLSQGAPNSTAGGSSSTYPASSKRSVATPVNVRTNPAWTLPYPQASDATHDIFGVDVTVSSVNIAGTGSNVAIVNPGSSVSVSFNWHYHAIGQEYCPNCIVQYYWGLTYTTDPANPSSGSSTPIRFCYNMGTWYTASYGDESGSESTSFTAPSNPGVYWFQWGSSLDYVCENKGFSQCGSGSWAGLCVDGDTDGDGVIDCFDNCPCVYNPDQSSTNGVGNACPFFATVPASTNELCSAPSFAEPIMRNDYCGASRSSTDFISLVEQSNYVAGTCPQTITRSWTATQSCSGDVQTASQTIDLFSYCSNSVTSLSQASVQIQSFTSWGGEGAPQQYLMSVNIVASSTEALNDWRLEVDFPDAGESVVSQWSVYAGGVYDCAASTPAMLGIAPSGQWSAQLAAGASVNVEYVGTNNAGLSDAAVQAGTVFRVYRTANS